VVQGLIRQWGWSDIIKRMKMDIVWVSMITPFASRKKMKIEQIKTDKAKPFILKKHYAKRMPSISYAFGLFIDEGMIGVVTYGTPASSTLLRGVCGEQFANSVVELNRLVINSNAPKNSASFLVGNSMSLLGDKIIVS